MLHILISLENQLLEKMDLVFLPVIFEPQPPNSARTVRDFWCIIPFIRSLIGVLNANNILKTKVLSKLSQHLTFYFCCIHNPQHTWLSRHVEICAHQLRSSFGLQPFFCGLAHSIRAMRVMSLIRIQSKEAGAMGHFAVEVCKVGGQRQSH